MLGRELNGYRAYALELWVESRERVADELCARADCFARLGFVEEAGGDRYVAGRLRNRADIDRAEAAELWRCLQCCSGSPYCAFGERPAMGDCQESCVRGHSDADGGRLWRSRKTPWTSFWTAVTRKRFSTRTGFSTS